MSARHPNANFEHEAQVRAMRDAVFEQKSSDGNWWGCADHWLEEEATEWLRRKLAERACCDVAQSPDRRS